MVVGEMTQEVELVVIGGGPGGYPAAIRASQLGIKCALVDPLPRLGGACLNVGCIPSKALLTASELIENSRVAAGLGIHFGKPAIKLEELRAWKESVTQRLASGIAGMLKSQGVEVIAGRAIFTDSRNIRIENGRQEAPARIKFKNAIVATGSRPVIPDSLRLDSTRLLDSSSALEIKDIPASLLVIGGGYIGAEMGTVYASLGSAVTVVEMTDTLLPGVDRDLVRPLASHLESRFTAIHLNTTVTSLTEKADGVVVAFEGKDSPKSTKFDKVLVAVGRRPNSDDIGLENTRVEIDEHGYVIIDDRCRTADKRILAVGDVTGSPMLAHRATRQGHVAAEVLAGLPSAYDNRACPAVVFTEPEIAWCGLTENEAKEKGVKVKPVKFPWSASGRAHTLGQPVGQTKIIYDPDTTAVVGVGMVGPRAGELIAEAVLAIEMGALLEDLAVTIHPHPTLSETVQEAAAAGLHRLERESKQDPAQAKTRA